MEAAWRRICGMCGECSGEYGDEFGKRECRTSLNGDFNGEPW